jgi:anaerobic carbon-monoxide dehydrogenase iron sulfur subunit
MMSKTIVVNINKCMACKSCELACALVHSKSQTIADAITETPKPQRMVTVEQVGDKGVPMQCRHCENAPCIAVCPTAALHRHEIYDPVLIDRERCIGCRFCLTACPFGVIDMARDGKAVVKCDLCMKRTQAGEMPACVASCPTGALQYCELTEMLINRRRAAAKLAAATISGSNESTTENSDDTGKGR